MKVCERIKECARRVWNKTRAKILKNAPMTEGSPEHHTHPFGTAVAR
jgi:hypothetical protein